MHRTASIFAFLFLTCSIASSQSQIGEGQQPQVTVDQSGLIRVVYGRADTIYYSTSLDDGQTFDQPVPVGSVSAMHLGMTRGPQLATSKDLTIVTAMDKVGNIHCFKLNHKAGKWQKIQNVNDLKSSAPEGLMSVAADGNNNFYAVWLDVRDGRKNNISFSTLNNKSGWTKNRFVYKSPEGSVCECCKPSIAVKGKNVSIMFRNWLKGSRDLYLITSSDAGQTFTEAQKLGNGTWPLKGCPMDGGGLTIDLENNIHTAWQREGIVFYADPGKPEERLGEGRGVSLNGNLVSWEKGSDLIVRRIGEDERKIGEGTALKVFQLKDNSILAIWEKDGHIVYKKYRG